MPNNQHAAILRQMAKDYPFHRNPPKPSKEALLAGVEALEAVEVAKAALREVHEKADDWHSSVEWEGREYTGAVIETIDTALARLEGSNG
jgi:hypothetical protein